MSDWRQHCDPNHCYRDMHVLDFSKFKDCFPGQISMSDIDGCVEMSTCFFFQEWKREPGLPDGQRFMFERLTMLDPLRIIVAVIVGDAGKATPKAIQFISKGVTGPLKPCNQEQLRGYLKDWASKVRPEGLVK